MNIMPAIIITVGVIAAIGWLFYAWMHTNKGKKWLASL